MESVLWRLWVAEGKSRTQVQGKRSPVGEPGQESTLGAAFFQDLGNPPARRQDGQISMDVSLGMGWSSSDVSSTFIRDSTWSICLNCQGTLMSYGERIQTEDEQQHPRNDVRSDDIPDDDDQQQDEDVDMDKEEVDELIWKAQATGRRQQAEHDRHEEHKYPDRTNDTMGTGNGQKDDRPRTPPPEPGSGVSTHIKREREPREREDEEARRDEERAEKQREETERKANPLPIWAIRLVPGSIIECTTEAVNVDAVDGAARVIDVVVMTHLKARYKPFYTSWSTWMRQSTRRVINQGTIHEFDSYYPHLGTDKHGLLKPRREEDMKAWFEKKKSSEGEVGGRNEEAYLRGTIGTRIMCRLMKHLVETGMKPASFTTMVADNPDMRRSSSMVRKFILGTFGVRSCDCFRAN